VLCQVLAVDVFGSCGTRHQSLRPVVEFYNAGVSSGMVVFMLLLTLSAPEPFLIWCWRVPFLRGVLLCIGLFLRLKVKETPVFAAAQPGVHCRCWRCRAGTRSPSPVRLPRRARIIIARDLLACRATC
jgi:hypothetical protein